MKKKIKKIIITFAMVLMVMAAVKATTIEAKAAGLFDPVYYAQTYPDVAAALGTDATALYNHYVNFGQKEGRIPYAGGQPGEVVDGIANATTETLAVQTAPSTVDIGDGPYWLLTGEEVDKATFLQKMQEVRQKIDTAGYARVGWSESQVQEKLYSIKEVYPEGTVVGICSEGADKIKAALFGGDYVSCVGTVARGEDSFDWIWADEPVRKKMVGPYTPMKSYIRVGDQIFTNNSKGGHVVVVLSHDDRGITVVESNLNGDKKMHWGRFISWDELNDKLRYVYHFEY